MSLSNANMEELTKIVTLLLLFLIQCLNKPYPDIWLVGPINKNMKPSRTLQTNRHISPLDPVYQLPSGPCLIPQGDKVTLIISSHELMN